MSERSKHSGVSDVRLRTRFGVVVATLALVVGTAGPAAAATPLAPQAPSAPEAPPPRAAGASTVTGVVQDVVVDNPQHRADRDEIRRILRVGRDVIPLTDGSLPAAESGATVRATVAPAGDGAQRVLSSVTVADAPAAGAAAAGASAAAASTHDVFIAIVRPKGIAADARLTATAARAAVTRAASYWTSQTGGLVNFRVANPVIPSYVSEYRCTSASAERLMWDEALGKVSIPTTANQHLIIFVPQAASAGGCSYGLGSVGFWPGKPGLTFVADTNQSLVAHELGHNLGLRHANALRCGRSQDVTYSSGQGWPSSCLADHQEYHDLLDVMGYSGVGYGEGSLNAVHLDAMGHLPGAVRTITETGSYTVRIAPLSAGADSLRAVRIVEPTGVSYYLEYRTNSGRDTVAARNPWHPSLGVRVLRADPRYSESGSYVLDATPSGKPYDYTNNLAVGRTFTSAGRRVTVKVTRADSAGATVVIDNGTLSAPTRATLSGLPSAATARAAVTARVTVSDAAGRPVPDWSVSLQRRARGGRYVTVKRLRTDLDGRAALRLAHSATAGYRWVTAADNGAASTVSNGRVVTARAVVKVRRPARAVRTRKRLTVTGSLSRVPSPAVYVQVRKAGGRWRSVRAKVRGAAVRGSVKLPRRGAYQVRLYVKSDARGRYLGDYSRFYRVSSR